MKYAIYNAENGLISSTIEVPDSFADPSSVAAIAAQDDEYVMVAEGVQGTTHYIKPDTGKANLRGSTPCTPSTLTLPADGSTALTLSQMRPNTVVRVSGPIEGELTVTDGGSDTLTFAVPGTYTITASAPFPALPKQLIIEAQ